MMRSRLLIYAEAPPLGENVVTHGLFRASTPILRAISDVIDMIALLPRGRRFREAMLDPQLAPLCTNRSRLFPWLRAIARRLGLNRPLDAALARLLIDPQVARSRASHILCLEGSDPEVLAHVAGIAERTCKPFSVYVVDDFLTPMRLTGEKNKTVAAAAVQARAALRSASHVFSISDGLGALFEKNFGVKTVTLPLVFEPGPGVSAPLKKQVIFVGSVNFLYADTLQLLIEEVGAVRAETGEDLSIRLTSASAASLGPLPPYVHVQPLDSAENLAREISASLFAFLPYSFDVKVAEMVRTSFPSKLMEYLAYARSIVVLAPDYANSTAYFRAHDLPELVHDRKALREQLLRHLREAPIHSDLYRPLLHRIHSPAAARETILSTLFPSVS